MNNKRKLYSYITKKNKIIYLILYDTTIIKFFTCYTYEFKKYNKF